MIVLTVCFFISEWLIPLKYPLHNHFTKCALGYQHSSKTPPLSFSLSPLLNLQTVKVPLFRQFLPIYRFLLNPPKNQIFQWTPIILEFFILNPISSFKFLVDISQFKFLIVTEKNIFVNFFCHKIFQIFCLFFYVKIATLPLKRANPSKNWDPAKP